MSLIPHASRGITGSHKSAVQEQSTEFRFEKPPMDLLAELALVGCQHGSPASYFFNFSRITLNSIYLTLSHCQNSQHWLKKNHLIFAVSALTILTQAANLETSFQSAQSNPSHGKLLATCSFASGEPRKCCRAVCTSQWLFSVSECIVHIRIAVTQGLIYYSKVMRKLNNEKI